ncbi:MAG TPA: hypothetical protein PK733_07915 [Clostridiales bacterium]|nr:hypothetical protein [Clostridiales bacterium]
MMTEQLDKWVDSYCEGFPFAMDPGFAISVCQCIPVERIPFSIK